MVEVASVPVARSGQGGALAGGSGEERRIVTLDGLRGLMTIMVIISHYFGELPSSFRGLMFGWIAVDMFFVLSGFLIGRLILEKQKHANFFVVFYVRRFCRIIPVYVLVVIVMFLVMRWIDGPWIDADVQFPIWSYLTFTNSFFMVSTGSIGAHWLAPTWTLAVEEHFYLVIPAVIVFTPRRWLVHVLMASAVAAVGLRMAIYYFGVGNEMAALVLLPARADILVCGLLAAVAIKAEGFPWPRFDQALRVAPLVLLVSVIVLKLLGHDLFEIWGPLLVAMACAAFLLSIVRGAPESKRFESKVLQFFGNNGYCLYLTHLPVLGLMHGLILGSRPDLATFEQWLVTLVALPVCVLVGWGLTKLVEEPLTRYGRSWRWSGERRARHGASVSPPPPGSPPRPVAPSASSS